LEEAKTTGLVDHPGIVPVHALGRDPAGRPILVMKRVEGVSWRQLLDDSTDVAWTTLERPGTDRLAFHLETLMQVCNALAFAHRRGIIHRDIKPSNVMVGEFGEVFLLDWGIACPIQRGAGASSSDETAPAATLCGTPAYMAPEMLSLD